MRPIPALDAYADLLTCVIASGEEKFVWELRVVRVTTGASVCTLSVDALSRTGRCAPTDGAASAAASRRRLKRETIVKFAREGRIGVDERDNESGG